MIAITNQKGGVGKTTIAYNLACILSSRRNTKVLVIDNDPQGNLTTSFLEDPTHLKGHVLQAYDSQHVIPHELTANLHLLGADISLAPVAERDFQVIFHLKESVEKLIASTGISPYDFVIIDCLPSFGHLHLASLHASDYVLIPVKVAPYALAGMKDLFGTIEKVKSYINPGLRVLGIVINQLDGRGLVMEREMEELLRENYGGLVCKTKIFKRVKIEESPAFQQCIAGYEPKGPSAKEFKSLAGEIVQRIRKTSRGLK